LDPETGAWELLPPLLKPRKQCCAAVCRG
jgi:hypothetical protein